MITITRGWPPARRAAQAQNIRKTRPWLHATGPKTYHGKRKVRLNAQKHGFQNAAWRGLHAALKAQKRFLKLVKPLLNPALSPAEFQRLKRAIVAQALASAAKNRRYA
jgi:hypothetical protein